MTTGPAVRADRGARPAAAAAVLIGVGQTAISAYWALGGFWGIATVGGAIQEMAVTGDARAHWLAWAATVLKAAGVVLALLLATRGGSGSTRMLLLIAGWGAAAVLTLYGGVLSLVGLLALTGVLTIPPGADRYALGWHLAFWDPVFLLWGLALGVTVRWFQRRTHTG